MQSRHILQLLSWVILSSLVSINCISAAAVSIPNGWSASWDYLQHMSPLVQFQGGVTANGVQCKPDLTLLVKIENGSPACVTPVSAERLKKQGWILAIGKQSNQYYADLATPLAEQVIPGPRPTSTCPGAVHVPSHVVNSTGFHAYNFSGSDDYVISPGQKGTLTYRIDASGQLNLTSSLYQSSFGQSVLNYIAFYSQENFTMKQTVVSKTIDFGNGTISDGYTACYTLPYPYLGRDCHGGPGPLPSNITSVLVPGYDPPMGISMMSAPRSEDVKIGGIYDVTTMISVSKDVKQGAYWIALPPGVCRGGGLALITVGNQPYSNQDVEH